MTDNDQPDLTSLTVELLSAYLSNNTVASEDLPNLITATRTALAQPAAPPAVVEDAPAFIPAVSVRKSLASPDHIISLIDGKPYKTLKRHLSSNGLTEAEYRQRYNLPASYPTVAPSYSDKRRAVAKARGFGRRASAPIAAPAVASAELPPVADAVPAPAPRVRAPRKAPVKSAAKAPKAPRAPKAKAVLDTKAAVESAPVLDGVAATNPGVTPLSTTKPSSTKRKMARPTVIQTLDSSTDKVAKATKRRTAAISLPKKIDEAVPAKAVAKKIPRKVTAKTSEPAASTVEARKMRGRPRLSIALPEESVG